MDARLTWTANLLIVVGLCFLSQKRRWPFLFTITGEAIYVAAALASGQWDLAFICVVFCGLAVKNLASWEMMP
jgi:hypothetical protein